MTVGGFRTPGRGLFEHTASEVVIYDQQGNPIGVFFNHGGSVEFSVAGDDDFDSVLKMLGRSVEVREVKPR